MAEFLKQLLELGEEFIETIKHKTKLSTIFDMYTEKVIPTFVSEIDLKEYYKKRMEEINNIIDKL
jgi:predicted nucleic-acid-binding Zn-ribbon protein